MIPIIDWQQSFAGKRVFVTGATGFKGAWLCLLLDKLGAEVHAHGLEPDTTPNLFHAADVASKLASMTVADICDAPALESAMRAARADFVFHLAAQSLVKRGYLVPRTTYLTNVQGTATLLDVVRTGNRPCVVIAVTSDKCYGGPPTAAGHREQDELGGHDPYSASKAAAEIVISSFRRSYFSPRSLAEHGVKLASVRAGNVIGGGDWAADRLVPDLVRCLQAAQPLEVRSPNSVRPWQHVLDCLGGYLRLAGQMAMSDDPQWCEAWNFGPQVADERTVRQFVEEFLQVWGGGTWVDVSGGEHLHETGVLRLCSEKARTNLGWTPRWEFSRALRHTARWYQEFERDPRGARDYCLADIHDYLDAKEASHRAISRLVGAASADSR